MTLEQRAKLLRENPDAFTDFDALNDTRTEQQRIMDRLATAGYSTVNGVLMNAPDFLLSLTNKDAYKKLKELREKNQSADNLGTIASMFTPGGWISKGLGIGAKAVGAAKIGENLTKAGKFLGGSELTGNLLQKAGQGALRGAGQSAEQAIPRALFGAGAAETDEQRQAALMGLPLSIGAGGVGGAVLGPLASKLLGKSKAGAGAGDTTAQFLGNEAREVLDKFTLQQAGIETRALRQAARSAGFGNPSRAARDGGDYVNELAAGLRDRGVRGKKDFEALIDKNNKAWDDIDKAFEKNSPDKWQQDFSNQLASNGDLLGKIDEAGDYATDAFQKIASKMQKNTSLGSKKQELGNMIRDGLNSIDPKQKAEGFVANQIKRELDDYAANLSGLDVADAKRDYKLIQPFLRQEGREVFTLTKIGGGSPTFEKSAIGNALTGGLTTGAITSGAGTEQGFDPAKALGGLAGGAILGGAANKLLPMLLNKGAAEAGRAAGGLLAKPGVQAALEKAVNQAPNALVRGAATAAGKPAAKSENPEETTATKEAALPPDQVPKAQKQFSQKFAGVLNKKLETMYQQYYSDMDPQDFLQRVAAKTGNFQDMRQVANFLYTNTKEKDTFLRKYDAFLALKNVDIDKAAKGGSAFDFLPGMDQSGKENKKLLVQTMLDLMTDGDPEKQTKAQKQKIEEQLDEAKDNPEMMNQLLKRYGLDFADLAELGITE